MTLSAGGSRPAGPRVMTPRRAALKAQVEAAIANVRNSPRLAKLTLSSAAAIPKISKIPRYRAKLGQGQNIVKQVMDLDKKSSVSTFKRMSSEAAKPSLIPVLASRATPRCRTLLISPGC